MYERNEGMGIEPVPKEDYTPLEFGDWMHKLLEMKVRPDVSYNIPPNDALQLEAEIMLNKYSQHYPKEEWDIVDVERTILVQLPDSKHILALKIDLVVRKHSNGHLTIIDHKTEGRGTKSNLPQKWAARDQASLYLWAARQYYQEPVDNFVVDILTRQSRAGQIDPSFPERQILERTQLQIGLAIRDIIYVADQIEYCKKTYGNHMIWPANREHCYTYFPCDFYTIHLFGDDDNMQEYKFQTRKEYLQLEGIEVLRCGTARKDM